jgi:hypothetical protein
MTIEETKEEYGYNADELCKNLCYLCTTNDWYCPSDCDTIAWIRNNYDKAIERLAKLDGDYVEMCRRIHRHRWK